ncbi:MAG: glycosyltransferase family 4 protein [Thermoproteota archaeon]
MRVLFTPHVAHYTIGLSQELSKYLRLVLLTDRRFDTPSKQVVIPNLPIPNFKGLVKWFFFRPFSPLFDVIHVNSSQEGLFAGNFGKLVVTEHGWPDPKLVEKSELQYYLKERDALIQLYKEGARITTVSNYSAEMLKRIYGIRTHRVIRHGLLEMFLSHTPKEASKEQRVLWVSRLVSMKEPLVFLNALVRIRDKLSFKAFLRGDGPLRRALENYVNKNGLEGKVFFKNRVDFRKLPNLYDSCSIYVHSCSREPFGLSILEAMGSGLPVIVPSSGGAYEVAGEAALAFKPQDPEDLAEKISSLACDAELYEKLSRKSLERARKFTWKKAAKEYLEVYKEII